VVSKINFHPENWGSDEPKFDFIFGIFASADAEKLSQLPLRYPKVLKNVISLKLTASLHLKMEWLEDDDPKSGICQPGRFSKMFLFEGV